jgi:hypothetical protein
MSDAASVSALAERVREARRAWVQLTPRQAVCVERPGWAARAEMAGLRGVALVQHVLRTRVVGWRGFVESDAHPAGGAEAVPFDADLWCLLADDQEAWIVTVMDALRGVQDAHDKAVEAASGN